MRRTIKRFAGSQWPVHAEPTEAFLRELVDAVWESARCTGAGVEFHS